MLKTTANRTLSLLMSLILVAAFALPVPALAAQPRVEIENHTAGGQKAVHRLRCFAQYGALQLCPQPGQVTPASTNCAVTVASLSGTIR